MPFSDLQGRTLTAADVRNDEIVFVGDDGRVWRLFHVQDCCESVTVDDVTGDTADLLGTPIMLAEERTSNNPDDGPMKSWSGDSCTWTFYELRTVKGSLTIRWFGESNGYYSEAVEFEGPRRHVQRNPDTWAVAGDRVREAGLVNLNDEPDLDAQYRAYFALGGR
jgi:hypothetical protein